MGATMVEKHFSMSRDLWGSDHKVSMTPDELRALVEGAKRIADDPAYREELLNSEYAKLARAGKEKILQDDEE